MRLMHSIWSKPAVENRWQVSSQLKKNIWLYGYSAWNAKKIADKLILHTDTMGAKYYGDLGYDEVKLSLNELNDEMSRFWAKGKMVALSKEPIGTIHIDGDVFIKKPTMRKVLNFKNYDLIVQGIEKLGIFMKHYFDTLPDYGFAFSGNIPTGFNPYLRHSLNCGVLGFNNQTLRQEYIDRFFKIIDQLKQSAYFMNKLNTDPKFEPNIMIEQYFLAGLCVLRKAKIKHVLPIKSAATDEKKTVNEMNETANKIGYAHAWGVTKYNLIEPIKAKLRKLDFRYYKKLRKIAGQL